VGVYVTVPSELIVTAPPEASVTATRCRPLPVMSFRGLTVRAGSAFVGVSEST